MKVEIEIDDLETVAKALNNAYEEALKCNQIINDSDLMFINNYIIKCCGDKYNDEQRAKNYIWRK